MILDSFKLDGKVALVTGASTGLGAAIAIGLAEAGANVVCHGNSHTPDATCNAITKSGRQSLAISGNMLDHATSRILIEQTLERFQRVDILVNNAGTIHRSPTVTHSDEDWDAVLDINLSSVFRLCKLAGMHMIEQGHGKIINIASLLSFQGGLAVASYAASKGGVAQLTKALANEWAGKGINVNAIAPGYIRTNLTCALQQDEIRNHQILDRIPAGRWGEPNDLSGAAVFLASPASDYLHGHVMAVDGGWMGR